MDTVQQVSPGPSTGHRQPAWALRPAPPLLDSTCRSRRKGEGTSPTAVQNNHLSSWSIKHYPLWLTIETSVPFKRKLHPYPSGYDFNAAAAKSLQSCPTLCDPIDGSPPGSPIPGILQARTLEWVAISFSNAWKWKVKVKLLSHVRHFATPWTAAHQAPPSMGFSRQEYWSGLPLPSPSIYSKGI